MKENPRSQLKVAIVGPLFLSRVENDVKLVTSTLSRTANDREGIKGRQAAADGGGDSAAGKRRRSGKEAAVMAGNAMSGRHTHGRRGMKDMALAHLSPPPRLGRCT